MSEIRSPQRPHALSRLAGGIRRIAGRGLRGGGHGRNERSIDQERLVALAQARVAERKRRAALFDTSIFVDPAWDILIDIAAMPAPGLPISLCGRGIVPPATALRYLGCIEDMGFTGRSAPSAGGTIYLMLTDRGRMALLDFLSGGKEPPAR